MATTDKAAEYDIAFVEMVYNFLPEELKGQGKKKILQWARAGLIQRDRLFEFAMSNTSGGLYETASDKGRDHTDGTDTKTVTINYRNSGKYLRENVIITNIGNKIGPLRVVAYDSKKQKFRFYYIFDYESVRSYNRIEFDVNGYSKYNNGECGIELYSFEDLAKKKYVVKKRK